MKIYDYGGKKNLSGERIREARVVQKLSQNELAAKMQIEGITIERDSISRIEIGTRFVADFELMISYISIERSNCCGEGLPLVRFKSSASALIRANSCSRPSFSFRSSSLFISKYGFMMSLSSLTHIRFHGLLFCL